MQPAQFSKVSAAINVQHHNFFPPIFFLYISFPSATFTRSLLLLYLSFYIFFLFLLSVYRRSSIHRPYTFFFYIKYVCALFPFSLSLFGPFIPLGCLFFYTFLPFLLHQKLTRPLLVQFVNKITIFQTVRREKRRISWVCVPGRVSLPYLPSYESISFWSPGERGRIFHPSAQVASTDASPSAARIPTENERCNKNFHLGLVTDDDDNEI